ncbi:putative zinc-dependent alcohol dehydrogenase [Myxozyma melibiosi]|uniref:Zinc-dependent alcohol dehydrogenase n=1 Tax=Myxozyma melibiosi TaxID=54550 RepID=A0ABR1FA25_9ASCO
MLRLAAASLSRLPASSSFLSSPSRLSSLSSSSSSAVFRRTMASMKALVYEGPAQKSWKSVPKAAIQAPTDAVVKLTSTTICGTDLHILKGDVATVTPGRILGHEGVGIVDSVGSGVSAFKPGDRVLISCITSCGKCLYCQRNMQAHCHSGGWILGNEIDGTQAEFVRIPYADTSLYAAPKALADDALLMLSDALPTGFEVGVRSAKIQPGESVAVVGAGPVGMAVLMTAQFYSPASIIMIDTDDSRLEVAKKLGATHTINPAKLGASSTILDAINAINNEQYTASGETPNPAMSAEPGVDVAIECVGIPQTFATCQSIIAPGGRIANVGVHGTKVDLQLQDLWIKNITITTGLVSANTTAMLLKVLQGGKVKPEALITHRFKLDDIEHAYEVFGNAAKEHAIKTFIEA